MLVSGADIAVLEIDAKGLSVPPLGTSEALIVGDFVIAVGNPFGLGQTVTSSIIGALGRSGIKPEGYEDFSQTDASINPGIPAVLWSRSMENLRAQTLQS